MSLFRHEKKALKQTTNPFTAYFVSYIEECRKTLGDILTRLLFTPDGVCPVCSRVLFFRDGFFCPDCQRHFHPVSGPVCRGCGTPVSEAGLYCRDCLREDGKLSGGIVFFRRDPVFDSMIRGLYAGKRPELMETLGTLMGRQAKKVWPGIRFTVVPGRDEEEKLAAAFEEATTEDASDENSPSGPPALLVVSLERDVARALSFLSESGMKVYCVSLFDT